LINIDNISFGYDPKDNQRKVFNSFSLTLNVENEDENPVVILGPSGCGKTTLLRLIGGLLQPQTGTITMEGVSKNPVSFIFQEDRLLEHLTVLENVKLPVQKKITPPASLTARAIFYLELAGLKDKVHTYPPSLSGGEKQRASFARAWCYPSDTILMDEPFQSMDIPLRIALMDSIKDFLKNDRRKTVLVTHDSRDAVYMGKRIIVLDKSGNIALDTKLDNPLHNRDYIASDVTLEKEIIKSLTS
jgi:NitT/TauT family transport system ATP-binding protein